jgi:hypothetical protein
MNLRPTLIISKDKIEKILIPEYLLNFFLKKKYSIFKEKKIYNFFLKFRKLFFLIKNINISLKIPEHIDYIIYDDVLSNQVQKVLNQVKE